MGRLWSAIYEIFLSDLWPILLAMHYQGKTKWDKGNFLTWLFHNKMDMLRGSHEVIVEKLLCITKLFLCLMKLTPWQGRPTLISQLPPTSGDAAARSTINERSFDDHHHHHLPTTIFKLNVLFCFSTDLLQTWTYHRYDLGGCRRGSEIFATSPRRDVAKFCYDYCGRIFLPICFKFGGNMPMA